MFAVVEFLDHDDEPAGEIAVVPICWLKNNDTKCYWPTNTKKRNFGDFVKDQTPCKSYWPCYKIYKVHLKTSSFDAAEKQLEQILNSQQSDVNESITSIRSTIVRKVPDDMAKGQSSPESSPEKITGLLDDHGNYKTTKRRVFSESSDDDLTRSSAKKLAQETNLGDPRGTCRSRIVKHGGFKKKSDCHGASERLETYRANFGETQHFRQNENLTEVLSRPQNVSNQIMLTPNNSENTSGVSTITVSPTRSTAENTSLDQIATHLCSIKAVLNQHSVILSRLQATSMNSSDTVVKPPLDFPDFPLKSVEEFLAFEHLIETNESAKTYMVHRLSAIGGSGLEGLTRRILKFLFTNELAQLYNWKGREKLSFEKTKIVDVIRCAVNMHFPISEQNDHLIENQIKDWLKYAKIRMKRNKCRT